MSRLQVDSPARPGAPLAPPGPGRTSRRWRPGRHFWAYLFISPFFILFAIFGLFPYLYAFYLSFLQWDGIGPQTWVGLDNYRELLRDGLWWKSLYNSFWLLVVTTVNLPIAMVLAFMLNNKLVRFRQVFRTAYFMPIVASSVAISVVFITLFGDRYGVLNYALGSVGVGPIDWLDSAFWIKPAIAVVVIWRLFGYNVIIYLAALQAIPEELYEAAKLDGASTRQTFLHITIPLMWPVITFTVVMSIIGSLQLFEEPLMLTGGTSSTSPGGTDRAGLTTLVYLYSMGFQYLRFGYSAAISVALFVVIAVFSVIYYRLLGRDRSM